MSQMESNEELTESEIEGLQARIDSIWDHGGGKGTKPTPQEWMDRIANALKKVREEIAQMEAQEAALLNEDHTARSPESSD